MQSILLYILVGFYQWGLLLLPMLCRCDATLTTTTTTIFLLNTGKFATFWTNTGSLSRPKKHKRFARTCARNLESVMGRPKAAGREGTKKREELERQGAQEQLAAAATTNPISGESQQAKGQGQQAQTFMQHDFGLDRRLIKAVAKMGFVYPTLVQNKCIPLALKGKDLLVSWLELNYLSTPPSCLSSACRVCISPLYGMYTRENKSAGEFELDIRRSCL